eukprot:scaffold10205_cov52-Cyclotella_meneghiniana.AAC.12
MLPLRTITIAVMLGLGIMSFMAGGSKYVKPRPRPKQHKTNDNITIKSFKRNKVLQGCMKNPPDRTQQLQGRRGEN